MKFFIFILLALYSVSSQSITLTTGELKKRFMKAVSQNVSPDIRLDLKKIYTPKPIEKRARLTWLKPEPPVGPVQFEYQWEEKGETKRVFGNARIDAFAKIAVSMIPVIVVGLFFKDQVEGLFTGNIFFVGMMLLFTAGLLAFTYYAKERRKDISFKDSFVIGIAQALAVIPGISRSGATIATGLYLGNKKEFIAKFSFLMVLVPIIAANVKDLLEFDLSIKGNVAITPLIVGFFAAFLTGLLACSWMIKIVRKGKLIYFAIYCLAVGLLAIIFSFI